MNIENGVREIARGGARTPWEPTMRVPEVDIQLFCAGCDNLSEAGVCTELGANTQGKRVLERFCGSAAVDGVIGQVEEGVFYSSSHKIG